MQKEISEAKPKFPVNNVTEYLLTCVIRYKHVDTSKNVSHQMEQDINNLDTNSDYDCLWKVKRD